jgi:putative endonuclease
VNAASSARAIGLDGERRARAYLESRGLRTVATNFRTRCGEVDLIMQDGNTLVFVEVRSRSRSGFASPAETIDGRKQKRLVMASERFLQSRGLLNDVPCRFDAVLICGTGEDREFEWIRDAFEA